MNSNITLQRSVTIQPETVQMLRVSFLQNLRTRWKLSGVWNSPDPELSRDETRSGGRRAGDRAGDRDRFCERREGTPGRSGGGLRSGVSGRRPSRARQFNRAYAILGNFAEQRFGNRFWHCKQAGTALCRETAGRRPATGRAGPRRSGAFKNLPFKRNIFCAFNHR